MKKQTIKQRTVTSWVSMKTMKMEKKKLGGEAYATMGLFFSPLAYSFCFYGWELVKARNFKTLGERKRDSSLGGRAWWGYKELGEETGGFLFWERVDRLDK